MLRHGKCLYIYVLLHMRVLRQRFVEVPRLSWSKASYS